jgi:hypothetical protein
MLDEIKFRIMSAVVDTTPLPDPEASSAKLQAALSTLFVIMGAISLLVITVAGSRYVISHGDPRLIKQSKDAIMYAVIGLVVSMASFAIVNFLIGRL